MRHLWKKGKPALAKGLLAAALAAGCLLIPSGAGYADSPRTIRVALFADIGSKYKLTVPAVTLQSGQAWSLTAEDAGTVLVTVPSGTKVRASLDGYRVKVLETSSWKTAADAAKKLQSTSDKPLLFLNSKGGSNVYQLYTGTYASESAAKNAADRVANAGLSLPADQLPAVKGGKHLTAGSYATQLEADTARASIAAAGVDAWTAVVPSEGGGSRYEVWVSEAASDSDLDAARIVLSQVLPQLSLTTASAGLMIRTEAGLDLNSETQAPHYAVSGGAKFMAAGSSAGIQLAERTKRTYRGSLELGGSNGSLSVINELPLEQYLYSVVGGEVSSSWPAEALKAQAVAARSYALAQGMRFDIANVVDTTLSQVYNGIGTEAASVTSAVDATAGEVLKSEGNIIEAVFSSNSGGVTADPSEVWNNGGDVFASVDSSGDSAAVAAAKKWYYVLLPGGAHGYVREDNVKLTGEKTAAGLDLLTAMTKDVNVRALPVLDSSVSPVGKLNPGENAVVLDKVLESGSYSWIKGPYTSAELLKSLQGKTNAALPSSIISLQVTERGPSGRAVQVKANGNALSVKYPDLYRSALGGLPSTLFDIVPSGSYTVLGADGRTASVSGSQQAGVLSASGMVTEGGSGTVVMNGDNKARVIDASPGFLFIGWGYGHGLGMSQWGVKGMAEQGYDYQKILQHYFQNVTIVKE
ncbi:stage II sporulation protein D [Paenibacillus sophorae]|uniref:SpoIID/LytB domain-containing protein n=1 Tax=Paenibacillus sophorae TaxID=1333845 RepID=A0A1H8RET2_9BACL|nr:SpoIID/LytB domain-containing protein [Paenibacillus sophorae]QWU15069.1 SpoIID/LytB domain-containing protein [Paenibacillus sophorae]SEO64951.1 stage II sporulation protein D [Paenibacillus sophorae]